MLHRLLVLATAAIASAAAATPVLAADSNLYGAASFGRSSIDANATAINAFGARNGVVTSTSTSSNDIGWKLQLGYQLTPSWALEGGYTSLGQAEYIVSAAAAGYPASGSKKADLFNLDFVGRIPISKSFSLLGRIGEYYWRTDSDLPFAGGMRNMSENGYDFKVGLGLQYDFTPNFAMRGEFERFNGVGKDTTTGDSKVNLFSIGAVLKF